MLEQPATKKDQPEEKPKKSILGHAIAVVILSLTVVALWMGFDNSTLTQKVTELKATLSADSDVYESLSADYDTTLDALNELTPLLKEYRKVYGNLPKPYKPKIALAESVEARCLAIGGYYEARSGTMVDKEVTLWMIVNRLTGVDGRNNGQFKPSICAVIAAGAGQQYESITASRIKLIKGIVWGTNANATPNFKDSKGEVIKEDKQAWDDILKLSNEIIAGKRSRLTVANHFVSLRGMGNRKVPSWVAALKPVGTTSDGHLMMVDYIKTKEGRVYLTKERPYNPFSDPKIDLNSL